MTWSSRKSTLTPKASAASALVSARRGTARPLVVLAVLTLPLQSTAEVATPIELALHAPLDEAVDGLGETGVELALGDKGLRAVAKLVLLAPEVLDAAR